MGARSHGAGTSGASAQGRGEGTETLHCLCFLLRTFFLCWSAPYCLLFLVYYVLYGFLLPPDFEYDHDSDADKCDLHYIYDDCNS